MREAAAAVEQAGDRVREQRAAHDRPGHHLGAGDDRIGQDTAIRSCASRQISDGCRKMRCGFRYTGP